VARVGQAGSTPSDPPALRAYAIYPYLTAARLQAALSGQPLAASAGQLDAHIAAFIQGQRGEPVTRGLAHDWLGSLAMRQQWPTFLAQLGDFTGAADDPVLACDTLSARLAIGATGARTTGGAGAAGSAAGSGDNDLALAALAVWSQPIEQPAACDAVFDWLQKQGLITPGRVEARARAALGAGHAGLGLRIAAQLPEGQAAPLLEWARLLQRPRPVLEALAEMPAMPVEPDALAAGVERLALSDSATAALVLPALLMRPGMTPELSGQLQRSVALGLAYDHAPGAAAALQELPTAVRDDTVCEWGARIALWTGNWPQALAWLDQLSAAAAGEPRWRYWRARALEVIAGDTVAAPLFNTLAGLRDYYGYLAADLVQLPYDLQAHRTPADPVLQSTLALRPGLIRAHELFECGLTDAAGFEWAVALQGASNAQRIQAAQLADDWGWYAQASAQLARADDLDDVALRYPRPYPELLARASALTDVPADWLLAVMRQESLFRADAVSRANARGLMQLQPTTASAVADRWHVVLNGPDALFDPAIAVTLGAARLRELLDQYDGGIALALAAYNAGTAPVARWRPAQPMDADIWIENIAYGETRDYVERVLEHIVAFHWARGAPPPRLSSLLPAVGPGPVAVTRSARAPSAPVWGTPVD
jgi:soluble lytic murein transglycosylase